MSLETEGRLYTFVILECCGIEQGVGWGFIPGESAINLRFSRPAANRLHLSANNLLDEDEVCQHSEILQHIPEGAAYNEPPSDPRARVPCHMICPQEAQRLLANQHQQWVLFCTRCTVLRAEQNASDHPSLRRFRCTGCQPQAPEGKRHSGVPSGSGPPLTCIGIFVDKCCWCWAIPQGPLRLSRCSFHKR